MNTVQTCRTGLTLLRLMRDKKQPRPVLESMIRRRLKRVLVSAYRNVPYYRKVMQSAGYHLGKDFSGPADLARLPITTKKIFKTANERGFLSKAAPYHRCYRNFTSGSTGIPISVYRSPRERAIEVAQWLRVLFLNGFTVRHKVAALSSPDRHQDRKNILHRMGLLRRYLIDYYLPVETVTEILIDIKPDVLYGNRSHLDLIALELKRRQLRLSGVRLVIGTGEVVHDSSRRLCKAYFGVDLIESYGSIEMGVMAHETNAHDGLHLCEDLNYFEFLNEKGKPVPPGEPGRVVVTGLTGTTMPFIRYDQGDRAVYRFASDENGHTVRRITRIAGREDDYATMADGNRRPYHDFARVICKYEDIYQFRIVQKRLNRFQVQVVADPAYLTRIRNELLQRLAEAFPPKTIFEILPVDQIETDPSGKIQKLVSQVNPDSN